MKNAWWMTSGTTLATFDAILSWYLHKCVLFQSAPPMPKTPVTLQCMQTMQMTTISMMWNIDKARVTHHSLHLMKLAASSTHVTSAMSRYPAINPHSLCLSSAVQYCYSTKMHTHAITQTRTFAITYTERVSLLSDL